MPKVGASSIKESRKMNYQFSLFTEYDSYLFKSGKHYKSYEKLGSHLLEVDGVAGCYFAVWAPNADSIFVKGDFNDWNAFSHPLQLKDDGSGIWEGFIPDVVEGVLYKYFIVSKYNSYMADKGDPYAVSWEVAPETASKTCKFDYKWNDSQWMEHRAYKNSIKAPISIYEVHLGSWARKTEEDNRWLTYRELAPKLAEYVTEMGFTHIELMPVMEHPFAGSWGYQVTGYFAPTSRFGSPEDFAYFVDYLHQKGVGVILDWVPAHFPSDIHGPVYFDGTHLYEHEDPRQGYHPDWQTYIFNFGRNEVRNFLISNAVYWFDRFHVDGMRVDAVASMLYLDYSRDHDAWIPNKNGSNENLDAIEFMKILNEVVYDEFPDVQMIAEESTAWPMVSWPTSEGGLGFGYKWNMGWMHDTLKYMNMDPVYRKDHHGSLTYCADYSFAENFMLPLSHDEVVHMKGSLLRKMPGDDWQRFSNLRLLFGYMMTFPGKKLLFQGGEFGQWNEWDYEKSIDWHLLEDVKHKNIHNWFKAINTFYKEQPPLFELDCEKGGFEWLCRLNADHSTISFLRRADNPEDNLIVACNFTPIPRPFSKIGVPKPGRWKVVMNSDSMEFGGSDYLKVTHFDSLPVPEGSYPDMLSLILPPLAMIVLQHETK